jgi:hypothetical protein
MNTYNKALTVNGQNTKVSYSFTYTGVKREVGGGRTEMDYQLILNGVEITIVRLFWITKSTRPAETFLFEGNGYKSEKKLAEAILAARPQILAPAPVAPVKDGGPAETLEPTPEAVAYIMAASAAHRADSI